MSDLLKVRGVGPAMARAMSEMGIVTPADLAASGPQDLVALPRVQLIRARMLISAAGEVLATLPQPVPEPRADADASKPGGAKKKKKKKTAKAGKKAKPDTAPAKRKKAGSRDGKKKKKKKA